MKYRTKVMVPATQPHDPDQVTEELRRAVREFDENQAKQEANANEEDR